MKIQIKQPVALHEKGEKKWNEDFILPAADKVNQNSRLFIISDGEGGKDVAYEASKLVALSFEKYFKSYPHDGNPDKEYLEKALRTAEGALTAYKEANPDEKEVASTLALIYIGESQVTMAWVGNSFVFFYDSSKKQLFSPNYSENNSGRIRDDDHKADIHIKVIPLDDIGENDYFLLASDGISEQADVNTLQTLLASAPEASPEFLLNEISNLASGFTNDNYSLYLIKVQSVDIPAAVSENIEQGAPTLVNNGATKTETFLKEKVVHENSDNGKLIRNLLAGALILILGALLTIAVISSRKSPYKKAMQTAESYFEKGDYLMAIKHYDEAIVYAEDEQNANNAKSRRTQAELKLQYTGDEAYSDIPPPSELTLSAEQYIEEGNERMKVGNYLGALNSYLKAKSKNESAGLESPPIPQDSVAIAHMRIGNKYFDEGNHEQALLHYEQVRKLLESPEINGEIAELQPLQGKIHISYQKTGRETDETDSIPMQQADQTPPISTSRSIASRSAGSTDTGESKNTSSNTDSNPGSASRRVSGINSDRIDPASESEMRKALSNGKRLYSQAKDQNSDYLFQQSALQLEQASPILDGSGAYLLAYMYHIGKGVEEDSKKALRYAQQAALKDWPAGHYLYAHLLLLRKYPRDSITARQSLKKASEQNFLEAINRLEALGSL